jgi:hypothetical protein
MRQRAARRGSGQGGGWALGQYWATLTFEVVQDGGPRRCANPVATALVTRVAAAGRRHATVRCGLSARQCRRRAAALAALGRRACRRLQWPRRGATAAAYVQVFQALREQALLRPVVDRVDRADQRVCLRKGPLRALQLPQPLQLLLCQLLAKLLRQARVTVLLQWEADVGLYVG